MQTIQKRNLFNENIVSQVQAKLKERKAIYELMHNETQEIATVYNYLELSQALDNDTITCTNCLRAYA